MNNSSAKLDAILARTNAELDEIEDARSKSKGACGECKFWGYEVSYGPVCRCPALTGLKYDPVDNKVRPKLTVPCSSAREKTGDCGPEGRCFVRKPEPPEPEPRRSLWWHFKEAFR